MPAPVRLQLRRTAGFRLQDASRAANGLPAIRVARPGPWGNPFPWTGRWITWAAVALGYRADPPGRRAAAVAFHLHWLTGIVRPGPLAVPQPGDDLIEFESGRSCSTREHCQGLATTFARMHAGDLGEIPAAPSLDTIRAALAGRNLACWCPPDGPCHADTLLAVAAGPPGTPPAAIFSTETAECP